MTCDWCGREYEEDGFVTITSGTREYTDICFQCSLFVDKVVSTPVFDES